MFAVGWFTLGVLCCLITFDLRLLVCFMLCLFDFTLMLVVVLVSLGFISLGFMVGLVLWNVRFDFVV